MYTDTHRTTDRTTNLLISSNVHYVYLGGDNYRFYRIVSTTDFLESFKNAAVYIMIFLYSVKYACG